MNHLTSVLPETASVSSCGCWGEVEHLLIGRSREPVPKATEGLPREKTSWFYSNEARLLLEGLQGFCGHRACFTSERLQRIEIDLDQSNPAKLFDPVGELKEIVENELKRVGRYPWLAGPLAQFRALLQTRMTEEERKSLPWLEAAFVIFMTTP